MRAQCALLPTRSGRVVWRFVGLGTVDVSALSVLWIYVPDHDSIRFLLSHIEIRFDVVEKPQLHVLAGIILWE